MDHSNRWQGKSNIAVLACQPQVDLGSAQIALPQKQLRSGNRGKKSHICTHENIYMSQLLGITWEEHADCWYTKRLTIYIGNDTKTHKNMGSYIYLLTLLKASQRQV